MASLRNQMSPSGADLPGDVADPADGRQRDAPGSSRPAAADSGEPFFSVTALARDLGVTARTIRFYEDKGLIAPGRAGAMRVYTRRDRARLMLILRGKRLGFSLREVGDYLDLYDMDPGQGAQLRLLVKKVRDRLDLLGEQRRALEETIAELTDIEAAATAALARETAG